MTEVADTPTVIRELRTACSAKLDREDWHTTVGVAVGDVALGVRVDSADTEDRVRALLAPWVRDDLEVDANYSVRLAPAPASGDGRRGPRPFHLLYRSFVPFVRSRRPVDVADALLAHLADIGGEAALAERLLRLRASAFVEGDHAVVAPHELWTGMGEVERRLSVAGLTVVNRHRVHLDPEDGALVVPTTTLEPPADGYAAFEGDGWAPPPERRLPVDRWVLLADRGASSRGRAVHLAARLSENLGQHGLQRDLDALASAVRRFSVISASGAGPIADAVLGRDA